MKSQLSGAYFLVLMEEPMNIFAEVLAAVLAEHGRELGSLFSMTTDFEAMNQHKVSLLKKSLAPDADHSAVLSTWELDVMRDYFRRTPRVRGQPPAPISKQQDRQLKAAIFAESIRRLVLERLKSEAEHIREPLSDTARTSAYRIGKLMYEVLLTIKDPQGVLQVDEMMDTFRGGQDSEDARLGDLMDTLRGGLDPEDERLRDAPAPVDAFSPAPSLIGEALVDPLAIGVEVFMQGSLWLEVARGFDGRDQQQVWAAYAFALLTRAHKLLNDAAPTDQRQRWLDEIGRALEDTRGLI